MEEKARNTIHQQMQSIAALLPTMDAEQLERIQWTLRLLIMISRDFSARS